MDEMQSKGSSIGVDLLKRVPAKRTRGIQKLGKAVFGAWDYLQFLLGPLELKSTENYDK